MHHDTPLISTIVAGLVLAYILGMVANRFRMPPLVGYLVAGVLVGPYTPGFVADQALGLELAEIGVILLMFGVGLHFSLKDLMSVRSLAIPGAIAQIALATLLGLGLALLMGWSIGAGIIFGLALSVASTVVLLKALQDRRLIETEKGRIAVGWLIVEDLAMVLALVLIPAFASLGAGETLVHDPFVSFVERILGTQVGIWGVLALTLIKLAAFVGFMLVVGRRAIPWTLHLTAHSGSRELFRLAVLAIALGVALGSAVLFGVSLALGAFFAGMILSESELSHRAAQETLPLRDAFAVLFFVSVGMLFDPSIILTDPLPVLATVFIIIIGKSLAAFAIVVLFKRPVATALTISASLAQIGEFSFILASLGVSLAILPPEGQNLILAGALITIILNPLVFWAADLARPMVEARAARFRAHQMERDGVVRIEPGETPAAASGPLTTDAPNAPAIDRGAPGADDDVYEPTQLTGHTVLVGYGRVGRVVSEGMLAAGAPLVVIEDSDHSVAAARQAGMEVVVGNAASEDVLRLANLPAARCLLIAIPNGYEAGSVCEAGRKLNPEIRIIARAHSDEEEAHLRGFGANDVILGEREIGLGMLALLDGKDERRATDAVTAEAATQLPPQDNLVQAAVIGDVALAGTEAEPVAAQPPAPPEETPDAPAEMEAVLATDIPGLDTLEPEDFAADADLAAAAPEAPQTELVDVEDAAEPEAVAPEPGSPAPELGAEETELAQADEPVVPVEEIAVSVTPVTTAGQVFVDPTPVLAHDMADLVPPAAAQGEEPEEVDPAPVDASSESVGDAEPAAPEVEDEEREPDVPAVVPEPRS
jgi:CPA2 family monovalent cation:H+ antiporter-2